MKNYDLNLIKKRYGENFAKLCRSLFPTLLEEEGKLFDIITKNFAESKFLYDDLISRELVDYFKNFVHTFVTREKRPKPTTVKSPFELMKKAGYTLYKCETDKDVKSFIKYYEPNEALCTFWDNNRINRNLVFFAVKDNVDEIKRENFPNPLRQDEYGTSVLSIQFSKTEPAMLSIKSRYNHSVLNSDATFSNDLENIIAGLTESFKKEYNLNFYSTVNDFNIVGYAVANDDRFYKYNYVIDNVFYCPNNIIIDKDRRPRQLNKDKYLVLDYFVLDLETQKIMAFDPNLSDSFVDTIKNITKIQVVKDGKNKKVILSENKGEDIVITIDKTNKIIKYSNPNVEYIGEDFLKHNFVLKEFSGASVKKIDNNFLELNSSLETLNLPSVEKIEHSFCKNNNSIKKIDFPNLTEVGHSFLMSCTKIDKCNLPNIKKVGNDFFKFNYVLDELNMPNIEEIGDDFALINRRITSVYAPKLRVVGSNFIRNAELLTSLDLPSLEQAGNDFLRFNLTINSVNFPKLKKAKKSFMKENLLLTKFYAPNLTEVGDMFLNANKNISKVDLPKLKVVGESFMLYNNSMKELHLPNIKTIGNNFFRFSNSLKSFKAPLLTEVGDNCLAHSFVLQDLYVPSLEKFGDGFLKFNRYRNKVLKKAAQDLHM